MRYRCGGLMPVLVERSLFDCTSRFLSDVEMRERATELECAMPQSVVLGWVVYLYERKVQSEHVV